MKFHKSLTMLPLVVSISSNSYSYDNTRFKFDENDLKNNLIHVNENTIKESKKENLLLFDTQYIRFRLDSYFEQWRSETAFSSDIGEITNNLYFKKILALGYKGIPAILEKIHTEPSNLVWSLNFITGTKISTSSISIETACKLWYKWGVNNRLIS